MTDIDIMCEEFYAKIEQAEIKGETRKLIAQVCRKLCKNQSIEQIADELEEDAAVIKPICDIAGEFAPEYDADKIYERLCVEV